MSFLKKIASALSPKGTDEGDVLWVYVRCDKCGEALKTRVDLRHDLTPNYSVRGASPTMSCARCLSAASAVSSLSR